MCDWHIPSWNVGDDASSTVLDGQSDWTVTAFPDLRLKAWAPSNLSDFTTAGVFPLFDSESVASGNIPTHVSFLFLGTNSSLSQSVSLDLAQTPSSYREDGFPLAAAQRDASSTDRNRTPRLASILICDPSTERINALVEAVAFDNGTSLVFDRIEEEPVGNFSPDAATAIMSQILQLATVLPGIYGPDTPEDTFVGALSAVAFVATNGTDRYTIYGSPRAIADSLDLAVNMMSEAFMGGYMGPDTPKSDFAASSMHSIEVQRLTVNIFLFGATPASHPSLERTHASSLSLLGSFLFCYSYNSSNHASMRYRVVKTCPQPLEFVLEEPFL